MVTALDEKVSTSFRQHLPYLSSPRFTTVKRQDAYSYADAFNTKQNPLRLHLQHLQIIMAYEVCAVPSVNCEIGLHCLSALQCTALNHTSSYRSG